MRAKLGAPPAITAAAEEVSQRRLAPEQCVGRHAECQRRTIVHTARFHAQDFAPTDIVVRAQPQPGGKCCSAPELRDVGANLGEDRVRSQDTDTRNGSQVHPKDTVEVAPQVEVWLIAEDFPAAHFGWSKWLRLRIHLGIKPLKLLLDLQVAGSHELLVMAVGGQRLL